ncbi:MULTISPECIES: pheST operon leader peptide PheM [Enterobacterales]|nr:MULTISPECIES: pheST operon leader peptide PheM [Enterobacterales]EFH3685932.1 pheST operon leader peptide PheM [Escherichia coli]EFR3284259.1 pheST operon leader peptide PheM [Salmonella enterica]MCP5757595.1 pheST operon leader peptide PheM [Klebsiella pneumoniae]EDQ9381950.1 pheST operon leader peptide PheM [Salmonella enterica subsp. enterica serovar Anatum]EEJ2754505.1 pheST operon leader peptide PheM [Salmonella enterica subsp. enterica serovar Anatum]
MNTAIFRFFFYFST